MRNLKKVLALVLAMAMSLSLAVTAGAAFNDQDKIVNDEAVDMCVALNVINGRTDGSFDPAGNVTRAEMAKMICIVLNGGKEPITATKAVPTFADIDGHWAEGYIEYCFAKGVVAGKSATEFAPNAGVTGTEAAKMLLVALGYNATVEKMVGENWALYTNVLANQDGLYEDLESMDPSAALSRDNAAQMIWNTLNAKTITATPTIDSDGSIAYTYSKSGMDLLTAKYNTATPVVGDLDWSNYDSDKGEWTYVVNGQNFVTDEDYTDLYMQNVKVIYKGKDVFGIFANDASVVVSGIIGDIQSVKADEIKISDVKYKAEAITYYAFGEGVKTPDCAAYAFEAIDNNDNGKIDRIVYHPFTVGEITYVGTKSVNIDKTVDSKSSFQIEDIDLYEGYAKEDKVVIFAKDNTPCGKTQFQKAEVISGEVTVINGSDYTIGGEVYTADAHMVGSMNLGDKVEAVVVNGYIFNVKLVDAAAAVAEMVYINGTEVTDSYGDKTLKARAIFTDGTTAEIVIGEVAGTEVKTANADTLKKTVDASALWVYEIDDGEYKLTAIKVGSADSDDFDKKDNTTESAGKDKIAGMRVNDDAVVYVVDKDGKIAVKSGADVAAWADTSVASVEAYANKTNGVLFVELAVVTMGSTQDVPNADADAVYGYVTDLKGQTKEDGTFYNSYVIWTATGEQTIKVKDTDDKLVNAAEGMYVKFMNGELTAANDGATVKITGMIGDSLYFNDNAKEFVVTEDTQIIYIDVEEKTGGEGALQLATDVDGKNGDDNNVYGKAEKNANSDGAYELIYLFVDINNDIDNNLK